MTTRIGRPLRTIGALCLVALVLAARGAPADSMDAHAFEQKLSLAEELSITEPWRESQALLDALRPHLELADDAQYARFMIVESRNLALAGDVDAALQRVERLLEQDMPPKLRLRAVSLGANIGQVARRYRSTFRYLNRAMELLGDASLVEPDVYSLAATMYVSVGEHERAIRYGRIGLEQSRQLEPRDECVARLRLGMVYREAGRLDDARGQHELAIPPCRESRDRLFLNSVQYRLADLLRQAGDREQARRLFERALEGLEEIGYRFGLSEARLYYARLESELGHAERVEKLLAPAIEDLERDANWQYLAEAHRLLAGIAEENGELRQALDHMRRAMTARGRMNERVRDRQVAFLQVQFEMRHTQQQLDMAQEQQRLQRIEDNGRKQQQRLRNAVYVAIALLVGVLVVLLFRATRDRRRFQSLSQRDALTALSNHTRFFELAERTLALSREKGLPFTLVLADIDHFKLVNDRYGHQAGDVVLRRVAARLREQFGQHGIIGRIGGEEFGIALPGMEVSRAAERLQVLRCSLAEMRHDDASIRVTMSFGVASPRDEESLVEIRERADRGLYEAKRTGRDRVVVADGPE